MKVSHKRARRTKVWGASWTSLARALFFQNLVVVAKGCLLVFFFFSKFSCSRKAWTGLQYAFQSDTLLLGWRIWRAILCSVAWSIVHLNWSIWCVSREGSCSKKSYLFSRRDWRGCCFWLLIVIFWCSNLGRRARQLMEPNPECRVYVDGSFKNKARRNTTVCFFNLFF